MPVRSVDNIVAQAEDLLEAFPPVTSSVNKEQADQLREEYYKLADSLTDTLEDPNISREDRNRIIDAKDKVMQRSTNYGMMVEQPSTGFLGFGARRHRRRTSKKKKTLRRRKRTSRR